jgi:prephenate dehydrogenase
VKPLANTTVVVGVGLIGASLAAAGKRAGALARVVGVGRSRENLAVAERAGIIDEAASDAETAVAGADLVVLAAPVDTCVSLLGRIGAAAPPGCVITDVASVKAPLVAAAERAGAAARFVGGHPIAGGTSVGAGSADAELFRDRVVVLTPSSVTARPAVDLVAQLWRACGARVVELDADTHDRMLALTSHLPQMLASSLAALAGRNERQDLVDLLCGAGFRDSTRIAASDAAMWGAIVRGNREQLLAEIDGFARLWGELRAAIARGDDGAVAGILEEGARVRRRLGSR